MKLQIDIKKIVTLLAKDIYDSPYALLRENLQNAYDAVLMRLAEDNSFEPKIDISVKDNTIVITDNGIGMTYDNVENNYWKAGSSGKNNEAARKAGVVGTFGIGAMANFGICQKLSVSTRYYRGNDTIMSSLYWEDLSYSDDCIKTEVVSDSDMPVGTTITAILQDGTTLSPDTAISYLKPYIQYLSIPVYFNGALVSRCEYADELMIDGKEVITVQKNVNGETFAYDICIKFLPYNNGLISVQVKNILYNNTQVVGDVVLLQDKGVLFGLRNGFGLASIPIASSFRWGGIVNLNNIVPTAGRDSVIRECIDFVATLIRDVERHAAEAYSRYDVCDNNTEFLNYLYNTGVNNLSLLENITINRQPTGDRFKLKHVEPKIGSKDVYSYQGSDQTIINQFANENSFVLVLSQNRVRKNLQKRYIDQKHIPDIPDNVTAKELSFEQLETGDLAITMRIESILENDYLMSNVKVCLAEISHNQPSLVEKEGETIKIYIAYKAASLLNLRNIYKNEIGMFDGFVKDYVRQQLYNKISAYVPSATKEGADALMKIMRQKSELFTIEDKEIGEIDEVLREYLAGRASIKDVHRASSAALNSQKQEVRSENIGDVEDVVPSVCADTDRNETIQSATADLAQPPILNLDNDTRLKLLQAREAYPGLNGFQMFLALSDKFFERYSDFFLEPHTTKVIWSTHKIVYVFTHISNQLSMYYDIDLNDVLPGELTGGRPIISTSIITKYKIFIPIIPEMYSYFEEIQNKGRLEFYVRFDPMSGK